MADTFGGTNPSVGIGDLVTTLKIANQNSSLLIQTLMAIFPRITGTFTATAAATSTVANTNIAANSIVVLVPINAAARTLQAGANMLSVSATTGGVGFTVVTAGGGSAAGTEQFSYYAVTTV